MMQFNTKYVNLLPQQSGSAWPRVVIASLVNDCTAEEYFTQGSREGSGYA